MSGQGPAAVDTDVHCAPASLATLRPYLSAYWHDYVDNANLALSASQGGAYPPEAPPSATDRARAAGACPSRDVGTLRGQVFEAPAGPPVGSAVLGCTSVFDVSRNPYFEAALCRAVNEWMSAEWLDEEPRLRGSIAVPSSDPTAAVAEIERCASDPRSVQVLLPVRGHDLRYGHTRFLPIFEAAAAHGLVVTLHAWGRVGSAPTTTGFTHTYLQDYLANGQVAQGQLVSMVAEGLLGRLPDLRVCVAECGFSWLPPLLWRVDKEWKGIWREVPWVTRPPSEYIREQVRFTSSPAQLPVEEHELAEALDVIGVAGRVMYASDHPHDHGDGTARMLAALGDDARAAVLARTAASFYRSLPVPVPSG